MLHKDLTGGDLHVTKLHAATHLAGGTDPLGLAESEITDLVADLSSKVGTGDARLSDARVASDVSAWAKEATKPAYAASEIADISAAGQALIDDVDAAAQRATLGTAAYSEGTWTPVINGFTIVGSAPAVTGKWKRIGNLMFVVCEIHAGSAGNTSVASVDSASYISAGLPINPAVPSVCSIMSGNDDLGSASVAVGGTLSSRTYSAKAASIYMVATFCV